MARGRAVAVVALLVLAGCQGFDSSGGETVTPAPVPTDDEERRAVDSRAVASGHRMALSDRSYTTTVSLTVTYPNGTTARLTDEFVVGADSSYRYERRIDGPYPEEISNFTVWQNGTTGFKRTTEDGRATVTENSGPGFEDITLSGFLASLFAGFDPTATRSDGVTTVTGSQSGAVGVPLPSKLVAGRNATLNAQIRGDVVRTATVRAQASLPETDRLADVRLRVTVRGVGESDPTRPAWATAANVTESG